MDTKRIKTDLMNDRLQATRSEALASRSILRVARAFSLEVVGGHASEVRPCTSVDCAFCPFTGGDSLRQRFGTAADLLHEAGPTKLADRSHEKRETGGKAWLERQSSLPDFNEDTAVRRQVESIANYAAERSPQEER